MSESIIIECEDGEIIANREILVNNSEYFSDMLSEEIEVLMGKTNRVSLRCSLKVGHEVINMFKSTKYIPRLGDLGIITGLSLIKTYISVLPKNKNTLNRISWLCMDCKEVLKKMSKEELISISPHISDDMMGINSIRECVHK